MALGDGGPAELVLLLSRILVAGFGSILTIVSIRSWLRYREGRLLLVTAALGLFAASGGLLTYDALTPGDLLPLLDLLVGFSLVQLLLLYLAIVRR